MHARAGRVVVATVAAAFVLCAAPAFAQQPLLEPVAGFRLSIPGAFGTFAATAGDVDGDGDLDGKVLVSGVTFPRFAGQPVTITAVPGGRAGTAPVQPDGTFRALVPAPKRSIAATVRYRASMDKRHSSTLRLARRFVITTALPSARGTRLTARVTGRRQAGVQVVIYRQLSCATRKVFKRVKLPAAGKVTITLPAPTGQEPVAYYRATTQVLDRTAGKRRFKTYSLPVAVRRAE